MSANAVIKARRIEGTNSWSATADYQGTPLVCPHRHATAHSARQCLDMVHMAREVRDAQDTADAVKAAEAVLRACTEQAAGEPLSVRLLDAIRRVDTIQAAGGWYRR